MREEDGQELSCRGLGREGGHGEQVGRTYRFVVDCVVLKCRRRVGWIAIRRVGSVASVSNVGEVWEGRGR